MPSKFPKLRYDRSLENGCTNRDKPRIIGQRYGCDFKCTAFDATNEVLLLSLDELQHLEDEQPSTDAIGAACLGPKKDTSVELVNHVKWFFKAERLADITEKQLQRARKKHKAQPREEAFMEVTLRVKVSKVNSAKWREVNFGMSFKTDLYQGYGAVMETTVVAKQLHVATP